MSYATLLQKEGIDSQYLAVISPKIQISSWSLVSGSTYSNSFTFGYISSVAVDGVDLAAGSLPLSAGQFYFNPDDALLYVRTADSANPTSKFVVGTFDLYFGTKDEHWYRDPLNNASDPIYFEARIQKTQEFKLDISDSLFGFQPIQRSNIVLINADHDIEEFLFDASFSKASLRVYHVLKQFSYDDIEISNIKLIYDGACGSVRYLESMIEIETVSGEDLLAKEYRNDGDSFFDTTSFPNLNPQNIGNPIRYVYGVVDGFVPVDIDFIDASTATTSDNRVWVATGEQNSIADITKTVGGGTHTTTRTYLTSVTGLRVDDSIWLDRASGTDEYKLITVVGSNYVEHAAIASPMTDGDSVKRSFVGNVTVIQGTTTFRPLYGRDYLGSNALAGGSAGFTFTNNFEASLSMPNPLTVNDQIFCRIYGRTNDITLGGPAFGSNDSESGNLTNPIVVILDLLKRVIGLPESKINASSFTAALADRTDAMGFAIPRASTDGFPDVKTIVAQIIQSSLLSLYIDDNLTWTIRAVGPLGASDITAADDEILQRSISYEFSYRDLISDCIVNYNFHEKSDDANSGIVTTDHVSGSSNVAKFLHGIELSKTIESLHFKETDAQQLADRYLFIFGDRAGNISIKAKNRFFETQIGDVLTVQRTKLPGFAYDSEVENSADFSVTAVTKNRTDATIQASDQKGIEDNAGSW